MMDLRPSERRSLVARDSSLDLPSSPHPNTVSLLDDWHRRASEGDRREALRHRLAEEGLHFIRQYAESRIPSASKNLAAFLESAEGQFIRQWLARVDPDLDGMTRSYAAILRRSDYSQFPWEGLFALSRPTAFGSNDFSIEAVTGTGLVEIYWSEGFWRGARFRMRPSSSERLLRGKVAEIVREGLDFTPPDAEKQVLWNDERFLAGTWDDWTLAVKQKIDDHMDTSSRLRGMMSDALRRQR